MWIKPTSVGVTLLTRSNSFLLMNHYSDNAYVSGLKEDLGFYGNELVHLQTNYILGAVLGQLPFMLLFTRVPMYYLIPALDILWGIFTLLQYRAQSYAELMAYRFCVGLFEVSCPVNHLPSLMRPRRDFTRLYTTYLAPGTVETRSHGEGAFSTLATPLGP